MQKLINILALLGFGMSATVTGGIGYVYMNQDSIKESIKQQVVDAATSGVKDALPGMMGGAVPPTTGLPVAPPTGGLFDKITKGYYTHDAMGCMMLLECEDGVKKIQSSADLIAEYPDADWGPVADEFDLIMRAFNTIGVGVYLADEKYFPPGHRGVYHTVGNNFFLNRAFMHRPSVLMSVTRHEGWHAAQDCMAGTIKNSLVAIIKPEEDVPMIWRTLAERTYLGAAVPWEAEAGWAGRTEGMTQKALESCARGTMWTDYEPTPMTREWLVENGYLKE